MGDPIAISWDLRFNEECKKVVDAMTNKYGQIDIATSLTTVHTPSPYVLAQGKN